MIIHHIPAACSSTTVRHRERELEHEQGKWEVGFTQKYRQNRIKKRATVEVRGDCNGGEMRALIPEGCEGL